jgi:hypothetical protein
MTSCVIENGQRQGHRGARMHWWDKSRRPSRFSAPPCREQGLYGPCPMPRDQVKASPVTPPWQGVRQGHSITLRREFGASSQPCDAAARVAMAPGQQQSPAVHSCSFVVGGTHRSSRRRLRMQPIQPFDARQALPSAGTGPRALSHLPATVNRRGRRSPSLPQPESGQRGHCQRLYIRSHD